jgi:hypothetical protein
MKMADDRPATGVVIEALQALRTNPLIVGVLLLNLLFVGVGAWYLISTEDRHAEHLKIILERCLPAKHEVQ